MKLLPPLLLGVLLTTLAPSQDDSAPPAREPTRAMLVVLNKAGASASLLDPATGEELARLPVGQGPHEAATSSDDRTVVVCDYGQRQPGNTLTVLDVVDRKVLRTIELTLPGADEDAAPQRFFRPHGIHFLPGGDRVVVTTEAQQRLCVVDIRRGVVESAAPTAARISHMVDLSPDATRAFVANIGSGSVSVVDLQRGECVASIDTGKGAEDVQAHPTRPEVWVTNRAANTLSIVDTRSLEEIAELECGGFPIRVAFTPDGERALVSCAADGTVEIWDVGTRERLRAIEMREKPLDDTAGERLFAGTFGESPVPVGILVRPDGKEAYIANTQADVVTVLDLVELRIARRLKVGPEPDGMTWVPGSTH